MRARRLLVVFFLTSSSLLFSSKCFGATVQAGAGVNLVDMPPVQVSSSPGAVVSQSANGLLARASASARLNSVSASAQSQNYYLPLGASAFGSSDTRFRLIEEGNGTGSTDPVPLSFNFRFSGNLNCRSVPKRLSRNTVNVSTAYFGYDSWLDSNRQAGGIGVTCQDGLKSTLGPYGSMGYGIYRISPLFLGVRPGSLPLPTQIFGSSATEAANLYNALFLRPGLRLPEVEQGVSFLVDTVISLKAKAIPNSDHILHIYLVVDATSSLIASSISNFSSTFESSSVSIDGDSPKGDRVFKVLFDGSRELSVRDDICLPSLARLCLSGDRFAVEAVGKSPQGSTLPGTATQTSPDSGAFSFSSTPGKIDVVASVSDHCSTNGRFWVNIASPTRNSATIRITDKKTGLARTYSRKQGVSPDIQDRNAFLCSPSGGKDANF